MFVAVEGAALLHKDPAGTLTNHILRWASWRDKSWGWIGRRAVLVGLLFWMLAHFISGGAFVWF